MEFTYAPVKQRSPEWFALRRGRVTASRLHDWLAVSKAKNSLGKPLQARLNYEKELIFERQFGVSYNNYVSDAMLDGQDFEDYAAQQYETITGTPTEESGIFYNDVFGATPDRLIGDDGMLEVKVVRDNTFTEILLSGVPEKHWQQIQGQLYASGRKWCDYIALNLNTRRVKIVRVEPDAEFHEYLAEALKEDLVTAEFSLEGVHDVMGETPKYLIEEESKSTGGTW